MVCTKLKRGNCKITKKKCSEKYTTKLRDYKKCSIYSKKMLTKKNTVKKKTVKKKFVKKTKKEPKKTLFRKLFRR